MQLKVAGSSMSHYPPRHGRGVCIWFTGRSGAGKSTTARVLVTLLREHGREVSVLDVVPWLEKTAFERTSRGKLLRKGYVAAEIVRHGGAVICVTISSSHEIREAVRKLIGEKDFVEVLVEAPPEVCTARKGGRPHKPSLIKRAKSLLRRVVAQMPLVRHSPYQPPLPPELTVSTTTHTPEENARAIFQYLVDAGFVVV